MHRNIFVLFAPGTGGNHIANMISTASGFERRANTEDYLKHRGKNAHVSKLKNLDPAYLININADNNNVLCGHWGEYYWLYITDQLSRFYNRQIAIVTLPKVESVAYRRFIHHCNISNYLIEEQRSLYTPLIFEKLFNDKDWFEIDPDWVFTSSLDLFLDFAREQMRLDLDTAACRSMHRIWFDKIQSTN